MSTFCVLLEDRCFERCAALRIDEGNACVAPAARSNRGHVITNYMGVRMNYERVMVHYVDVMTNHGRVMVNYAGVKTIYERVKVSYAGEMSNHGHVISNCMTEMPSFGQKMMVPRIKPSLSLQMAPP